jgi:arabinose-5-phosphate isomerase
MKVNSIDIAKEVFDIESTQIKNLSTILTEDFELAVQVILRGKGKLIVSGMGKSGIVGKKIAATLSSTGTPSFYLHPAEACHGDIGMIEKNDIILLISNSGETDEVLKLIPFLISQGNKTISMSSNPNSTLAKNSQYHLNIAVQKEACPLQLAPTSSTTATMVMGDALAVALMKHRGFEDQNFAKFHPGGRLGKRLLITVEEVMKKNPIPLVTFDASIMDVIQEITKGQCGLAIVQSSKEKVLGIISDGDIRRAMKEREDNFFKMRAEDIMTENPKTIFKDEKLTQASKQMTQHKINSLLVIDQDKNCLGIVQVFDIE